MPIVCWGNLAKSADSTERIEQSMQAYIEGHDENPNAHMGTDYALGAHRLAAELDHISGSVAFHHLVMDSYNSMTSFESLDGWNTNGTVLAGILSAMLSTGAGSPTDEAWMATKSSAGNGADPAKNPFFQTTVFLNSSTDQEGHIIMGCIRANDTYPLFGFSFHDNTLYAYWWGIDEAAHTHELTDCVATGVHCFRAQRDSTLDKVYFYVDGVLKHTLDSGLWNENISGFFEYYIKKTGVSNRAIYPIDLLIQMDR